MNLRLKYYSHPIELLAKNWPSLQSWPEMFINIAYFFLQNTPLFATISSRIEFINNSSYIKVIF